jgi:hypothetical protein
VVFSNTVMPAVSLMAFATKKCCGSHPDKAPRADGRRFGRRRGYV